MRVFVGYGYNAQDSWIEKQVFPILRAMNIETVHGKDIYGEVLQDAVKREIDRADALIGFCTLRKGQKNAEFNSHIWVRDEMVHALATGKPVVEVREQGVKNPPGLNGDRQRINLVQKDRLACITEVIQVVASWSMRRLFLVPNPVKNAMPVLKELVAGNLVVSYRTRFNGKDSPSRDGRIERINNGLYLNAIGLPSGSLVEVEGALRNGRKLFNTGWVSADLVRIEY